MHKFIPAVITVALVIAGAVVLLPKIQNSGSDAALKEIQQTSGGAEILSEEPSNNPQANAEAITNAFIKQMESEFSLFANETTDASLVVGDQNEINQLGEAYEGL